MRGADLESDDVLIRHLVEQLARASREAAALPDDAGWDLGMRLDDLAGVAEVLQARRRRNVK
jgi:hypothetical protein